MLIAAVVCLCTAAAVAILGVWLLAMPRPADPIRQVLRTVAPTQLAGAVMLAAGGAAAIAAPDGVGVPLLVVCVTGAVGTIAAGCYQAAKVVAVKEAATVGCAGACATCTLSCR